MLFTLLHLTLPYPLLASSESFEASNGYTIDRSTVSTESFTDSFLTVTSPSGETATFRIVVDRGETSSERLPAVAVGLDQSLLIDYSMKKAKATEDESKLALSPDQMVVQYAGVTETGPAMINEEKQSHPHYKLAQTAMGDLHSEDFYKGMKEAMGEYAPQAEGIGECLLAIAGYLLSFAGLAACGSVVGCIPAIAAHYVAIASVVASCTPLDF